MGITQWWNSGGITFDMGFVGGTYRLGGAREVPLLMVFLILEYYCDLSFSLFLRGKGDFLSSIPNSKVVLLSFIVLAKKSGKNSRHNFWYQRATKE